LKLQTNKPSMSSYSIFDSYSRILEYLGLRPKQPTAASEYLTFIQKRCELTFKVPFLQTCINL